MLESDGYMLLPGVYDDARLAALEAGLAAARARAGWMPHGGRNLIRSWPGLPNVVRETPAEVLLQGFVAWHKDLSIAASGPGERATVKAGVPHLDAPEEILRRTIAVRIHLDDTNEENGCLEVVPGSHREGRRVASTTGSRPVTARRGDVLLMRPLLTHRSRRSRPSARSGRRVIHLEWAPAGPPAPGLAWHDHEPL